MAQVYRIEAFNIWAESQKEADEMRQAFIDFINEMSRQGIMVTAPRVTEAVRNWQKNPFVRNRIIEHFKK